MWSNKSNANASSGLLPGRSTLGPLTLIALTPCIAIVLTHIFVQDKGSLLPFYNEVQQHGIVQTMQKIWPSPFDPTAWKLILTFMATQLLFIKVVPGKKVYGPITPGGNVPEYKANGFQTFVLSSVLFLTGAYYLKLYNGGIVYDNLLSIISALNVFSFLFCLFLLLKGLTFPSSSDSGSSGNLVFDFYWGTELYPRVLGWDMKLFTNCRSGMMYWGIGIISYACKQYELYGHVSDSMLVSVGLQLIYVGKFFWWESGYLRSIDIMHDRAGYYLCWGCLVWVPSVYTSQAMFLVQNPVQLGPYLAGNIFVAGVLMVWVNYDADSQRMYFRAKDGECNIWGKPAEFVVAKFKTEKNESKTSLLLTSGWWGISRHFHYIPEILAAFCWSVPALNTSLLPYFYVVYLTILLTDRAFRDDARCKAKYGKDWNKYCERVPYLIVPGIL